MPLNPDLVFLVGTAVLCAGLLPTMLNRYAVVPRTTSIVAALVLFVFAGTFAGMGFYWAAGVNWLNASLWVFIGAFRSDTKPFILERTTQYDRPKTPVKL